ncbi:MAG: prephenate dehydratase [Paludibacteraceae bacterium]
MKQVAIQGVEGSFHEIAARTYFSEEEIEIIPCETFRDVFESLNNNEEMIGIIAIENTIAGSLLQNHDLLRKSGCLIIGEIKLRITHQFAVLPGQKIDEIHEVHSHPIALMQCEDFLDQHKHIMAVESDDTALSAQEIAEKQITGRAAICSLSASEKYGLEILAESIETNKRNFTRFLIVAKPDKAYRMNRGMELNKSTIVFTLPHEEGSLSKVLTILSFYHVNLTKIQSLPIVGREWEYQFYVALTYNDYERYKQSLEAIKPLTREFQNLGEYRDSKTPND